jgi:hypothetical protein
MEERADRLACHDDRFTTHSDASTPELEYVGGRPVACVEPAVVHSQIRP